MCYVCEQEQKKRERECEYNRKMLPIRREERRRQEEERIRQRDKEWEEDTDSQELVKRFAKHLQERPDKPRPDLIEKGKRERAKQVLIDKAFAEKRKRELAHQELIDQKNDIDKCLAPLKKRVNSWNNYVREQLKVLSDEKKGIDSEIAMYELKRKALETDIEVFKV